MGPPLASHCARTTRQVEQLFVSYRVGRTRRPSPSAQLHNLERLTPGDAQLLEYEDRRGLPMHAGAVLLFEGVAPSIAALTEHVRSHLHLVPRYRRRVVAV